MEITNNNIDDIYRVICSKIINEGMVENNTKELMNVKFTLTDINNNIINIRDISKSYLFGELIWYLCARKDIDFIHKFSNFWVRISDDGVNCNSAYGDIIFKRHGFDQVEKMIELLKKDKNSRRAVINFNVPNINVIDTKDEICTIALQFYIRNNKLNCTGMMRSNDIWLGLPYDVAFFTELQKFIAHRLNFEYGAYTHFVVSMHAYDRNFNLIDRVKNISKNSKISLDIEKIYENRNKVEDLVLKSDNPKDDIVRYFKENKLFKEE
jgi:thymidylate synthase